MRRPSTCWRKRSPNCPMTDAVRLRAAIIAMLLAPAPAAIPDAPVLLGAEPAKQVHWAVGAFFGTGWYRVDDNRSVFILRIPPRQTVREAALSEDGERQLGVEIQYPLALGLSRLDDIPDFVDFDNYGTISFTPGVELERVADRFSMAASSVVLRTSIGITTVSPGSSRLSVCVAARSTRAMRASTRCLTPEDLTWTAHFARKRGFPVNGLRQIMSEDSATKCSYARQSVENRSSTVWRR